MISEPQFPLEEAPRHADGGNPRHCQETSLKLKPGFGKKLEDKPALDKHPS